MKLILKIAAGIVLGAITIFAIRLAIVGVAVDQMNTTVQKSLQNIQQRAQQQQANAQQARLRAQQAKDRQEVTHELKRIEMLEKINEKRRAEATEKAKQDAAFKAWLQMPEWCENPSEMDVLIRCADIKMRERTRFEQLTAKGNSAAQSSTTSN